MSMAVSNFLKIIKHLKNDTGRIQNPFGSFLSIFLCICITIILWDEINENVYKISLIILCFICILYAIMHYILSTLYDNLYYNYKSFLDIDMTHHKEVSEFLKIVEKKEKIINNNKRG